MPTFKLVRGGLQEKFLRSRTKIQLFGGGFANGKSASLCVKAVKLAEAYPGSNGLIARETYPKLNDTIRKEFLKWLPEASIKRKALSTDNVVELHNGTVINFRYIAQQGKSNEASTSNLLSATYDWIVIDQVEDPGISYKDFLDLQGRLRGMTPYVGDDDTMPVNGPRWMLLNCNPTRNWVYKHLVKPVHDYKKGIHNPELIVDPDTGKPWIEVFEGSTYENAQNLEDDYIKMLEATYKGQQRTRYLMGGWQAFEGLVYPQWDAATHLVEPDSIRMYFDDILRQRQPYSFIEGFDHGIAVPSCYLLAIADKFGNVIVLDGFYEKELSVDAITNKIRSIRNQWGCPPNSTILADPAIFRRTGGQHKTVGKSVAALMLENGIRTRRANNDILNGILKVGSYMEPVDNHRSPISHDFGYSYLYVNHDLEFIDNELTEYYWKRDTGGEFVDAPVDKNDHAADTLKYLLSDRPRIVHNTMTPQEAPPWMKWHEYEEQQDSRGHRYA